MSQADPAPTSSHEDVELAAARASLRQDRRALGKVVEGITPWLVDIGDWIFAGLIAFAVVIVAPLITVASVDRAFTIATAAFALALPLDLAGLVMLRLVRDEARLGFAEEWARAFREAGLPVGEQTPSSQAGESPRAMRTRIVLLFALGILALSVILALTGLVAALWHVAWWIGVAFLAMTIVSLGLVIAAFVAFGPPESPQQQERSRQYWEELLRQARERSTTSNTSP